MPAYIPEQSIAIWRSASGKVTASVDRCPHRGMRLSHGFVRGEALSCIYHGWRYGRDGQCLRIPAHPDLEPPKAIRVETFAVCEQDGIIWVGNGEIKGNPPLLSGFSPLRSMTISNGISAIEDAAGAKADHDGILKMANVSPADGSNLCLLLSPQSDSETLMLCGVPSEASTQQRIAASRIAETLRCQAEAMDEQEQSR